MTLCIHEINSLLSKMALLTTNLHTGACSLLSKDSGFTRELTHLRNANGFRDELAFPRSPQPLAFDRVALVMISPNNQVESLDMFAG